MPSKFEFPDVYSFPPFFTLQPVLDTREKQLALWRDLILRYHQHHRTPLLKAHDSPIWQNTAIDRKLNPKDVAAIMDDLCKHGHGEYNDNNKSACTIIWRTPEQLAVDIWNWAERNGYTGSGSAGICTVYELHSGEDVNGTSFEGVPEDVLRRGLEILQKQGKCTIFKGDTSEEDGIKFA